MSEKKIEVQHLKVLMMFGGIGSFGSQASSSKSDNQEVVWVSVSL